MARFKICRGCAVLGRRLTWWEHGHCEGESALAALVPPVPLTGSPEGDRRTSQCPTCGHWYALRTFVDHRDMYAPRQHTLTRLLPAAAKRRLKGKRREAYERGLPKLTARVWREAHSANAAVRADAGWWLGRWMIEEEDWDAYPQLLTHDRAEVRREALLALPDSGWEARLQPHVIACLDDEVGAVRRIAASLLVSVGELDRLVPCEDIEIATGVLRRLGAEDTVRHARWIAGWLSRRGTARAARDQLARHLDIAQAEALRPLLTELLTHEQPRARNGAAHVIGALVRKGWEAPSLCPAVAALLEDRATETVALAALASFAERGVNIDFAMPQVRAILQSGRSRGPISGVLLHPLWQGSVPALALQVEAMLGDRGDTVAMARIVAFARKHPVTSVLDLLRRVLREGSSKAQAHAARAMACEALRRQEADLLDEVLPAGGSPLEASVIAELASRPETVPDACLPTLVVHLDHHDRTVADYVRQTLERSIPTARIALRGALETAPDSPGRQSLLAQLGGSDGPREV